MKDPMTRRGFVRVAAAGSAALAGLGVHGVPSVLGAESDKPALLGGTPVHKGDWPSWPEWRESWEPDILQILRSGDWYRGGDTGRVPEFEAGYARLLGAKRCLATASGTTALITSLHAIGVDAGDEVIVSPYTFIATYNAILIHNALPVFADTDPATLTMDPASIESRITDRTRLILPVHIFGMPCDMDPINAIAKKHGFGVVEDACQAWLAEYQGRKCGTLGDLGCFSFQNSKHIPSGEGGRREQQQRRADRPLLRVPQLRPRHGDVPRGGLLHPGEQLPHAAFPGLDAPAAIRQTGQRDRDPAGKRGPSDRGSERHSRRGTGPIARE